MLFSYEKDPDVRELDDSKELYRKIIKNKHGIAYLEKLMEKKGVLSS